jgi:long-chain fatty acid transport protein
MMAYLKKLAIVGSLAFMPVSVLAQGAMLHGFGPINSAMGGAGTALPNESLGALAFNPALISGVKGNQLSFSTEFFIDDINIRTEAGVQVGDADPTSHWSVVPAFGWMSRKPDSKMSLGFGLIGIAGFGTDYPQDNASVLFAQPPNGFGRIWTSLAVTKIPLAVAYQVTPKLSLGLSLNGYVGQFAVAPLPHKDFDEQPNANRDRWYPLAGKPSQKYAFSGQFGFHYQATPSISLGGSITTAQNFSPYEWNSTVADPSSRNYGLHRRLSYDLDGPLVVSWGVAMTPGKKTQVALDGMFTKYEGVAGFGSVGGIVDRIVYPFGWRNVWTVKAGVQHAASEKLTLRAGYNYSQMPLRPEVVLSATGAPATFQHHFCGGFGYKVFPFLEMNASFYYVPRDHLIGPFPDLDGVVRGTLDESNELISALVGFNFKF